MLNDLQLNLVICLQVIYQFFVVVKGSLTFRIDASRPFVASLIFYSVLTPKVSLETIFATEEACTDVAAVLQRLLKD